jgi:hypothetical protein
MDLSPSSPLWYLGLLLLGIATGALIAWWRRE